MLSSKQRRTPTARAETQAHCWLLASLLLAGLAPAATGESDIDPAAIVLDFARKGGSLPLHKLQEAITMGDKSPKAKDKSRKQDIADRNQKLLAAKAKMSVSAVFPGTKTK